IETLIAAIARQIFITPIRHLRDIVALDEAKQAVHPLFAIVAKMDLRLLYIEVRRSDVRIVVAGTKGFRFDLYNGPRRFRPTRQLGEHKTDPILAFIDVTRIEKSKLDAA